MDGLVTAWLGSAHRLGAGLACLVLASIDLAPGLAWGHANFLRVNQNIPPST